MSDDRAMPRQANKRGTARLAAVQALYQMDLARSPLNDVIASFETFWMGKEVEGDEYLPADSIYFRNIIKGTLEHQIRIDQTVDALLSAGWPLKRIEAVLRAVLRAGAYELFERPDVPAKTIITEYMDVAAAFLDAEEVAMVNAVLDRIAKSVRKAEFAPSASGT